VPGRLSGVSMAGTGAVAAPKATALLDLARRDVASGQLLALSDVARKENHSYGSVIIASDVTAATARVTPLEPWQWASLQTSGNAPFAFAGPMGRYKVEMTAPGGARREQEFTIRPGAEQRILVALRSVAAGPGGGTAAPGKKKSKMPWILAGVGGVGLIGALAAGGGGGGGGGGGPPPPTTGSIHVSVPVNPP